MLRAVAKWAVGAQSNSLSARLRARRFTWFEHLLRNLQRQGACPLTILDIGGRSEFWERLGWAGKSDVHITLINLTEHEQRFENLVPVVGDATDLRDVNDDAYDVAFSNSVIEHLETHARQVAMAREMHRVARACWMQTPNFWFPMEPHFLVPGWQWLPATFRVELLHRLPIGGDRPEPDRPTATRRVRSIRLLTRREVTALFPDATIRAERFGGLVKSWIAYDGFGQAREESLARNLC